MKRKPTHSLASSLKLGMAGYYTQTDSETFNNLMSTTFWPLCCMIGFTITILFIKKRK